MLTQEVVDGIKKMFPHKMVDIIVQPADDTDYIMSNPAYAHELLARIEEYKSKKETISIKANELL